MLLIAIISLTSLFLINILFGMYYGFGFKHYWFFELEHFLGGFFAAMLLASFNNSVIFIFSGMVAISFLWELTEYLLSRIPKTKAYTKKAFHVKNINPEWKDTALDIILNFLGTMVFIALRSVF